MKLRLSIAIAALLVSSCAGSATYTEVGAGARVSSGDPGPASGEITVSYFYDSLSPYGYWVDYPAYGWCWVPTVSADWRPYSAGQWVYTEFGWTFVSYEPFGWATFHYGRWWNDPWVGWVWVPGTVWAPAWVAWANGPGWVGWTALPPTSTWSVSAGIRTGGEFAALGWCFVPEASLLDRDLSRRIVPAGRNVRLLRTTRPVTHYDSRGRVPVNRGPDVEDLEHRIGRRVPKQRIVAATRPAHGRDWRGGPVAVFRPEIRPPRGDERPPRGRQLRGPARPAAADGARRVEAQRQRLEHALADEQSRLEQRQARELRFPGRNRSQLEQRHADEQRRFREFSARQRKNFETRAELSRKHEPQGKDRPPRDRESDSRSRRGRKDGA